MVERVCDDDEGPNARRESRGDAHRRIEKCGRADAVLKTICRPIRAPSDKRGDQPVWRDGAHAVAVDFVIRAERVDAHGDGALEANVGALPVDASQRVPTRESRRPDELATDDGQQRDKEQCSPPRDHSAAPGNL